LLSKGCSLFLAKTLKLCTFEGANSMSNVGTTGRIPLWFVGVVAGILVLAVVGLFFYGAYSGLGSSL
jgi:photosystem II PsbJ protein